MLIFNIQTLNFSFGLQRELFFSASVGGCNIELNVLNFSETQIMNVECFSMFGFRQRTHI